MKGTGECVLKHDPVSAGNCLWYMHVLIKISVSIKYMYVHVQSCTSKFNAPNIHTDMQAQYIHKYNNNWRKSKNNSFIECRTLAGEGSSERHF